MLTSISLVISPTSSIDTCFFEYLWPYIIWSYEVAWSGVARRASQTHVLARSSLLCIVLDGLRFFYLKITTNFKDINLISSAQVTGPQQSCKDINISIPKKSILYKYRIDLDLATMLWARKNIFNLQSNWFVHARLDASLQYGKDYFMTECDIFRPDDVVRCGTMWPSLET